MKLALGLLLALGLFLPASALGGTVTRTESTITYDADPGTGAGENVTLSTDAGKAVIDSERGATTASAECQQEPGEPTRVTCTPVAIYIVNLLGFDDILYASALAGGSVEAHGGGGGDNFDGSPGNDRLFGDAGDDNMSGLAGDDLVEGGVGGDTIGGDQGADTLRGQEDDDRIVGDDGDDTIDGGPGSDGLEDGGGDDSVIGGAGDDRLLSGAGRDAFDGGDGSDTISYEGRVAPVTITLDGQPDDGEAGEGDNANNVEDATGGAGNDRIVGNASGNNLYGGAGNDNIAAGASADRVEGNEGDDTIDTRDGGYDSIDCGAGNDTVLADPGDFTENCESAPDADGDGFLADADCQPNNPAVNPGAGEVPGNDVDEDCKDGALYLRVINPISYSLQKKRSSRRVRFARLVIREVLAGDRIEIRCRGKGCPFRRRSLTGRTGTVNVARILKRRYLAPRALVEIRILRASQIGKVQRYRVTKRLGVTSTGLCLPPGKTAPEACA